MVQKYRLNCEGVGGMGLFKLENVFASNNNNNTNPYLLVGTTNVK